MAILKYTASADNTITNAFDSTIQNQATASNMGASDILEVFALYGQDSGSSGLSSEISRAIIKFPTSSMDYDRNTSGILPASGSVKFYLNLYNAPHGFTLPSDYKLTVARMTADWEEGYGLDMDEYKDKTWDGEGSSWVQRTGDDTPEITKIVFGSDTNSDYTADVGANCIKIYNGETPYNFWMNATDAAIYETSSYEFKSDTDTDYLAGAGAEYVKIYDGTDQYDFWFGKDVIHATTSFTFDGTNYDTAAESTITINDLSDTSREYKAVSGTPNPAIQEFQIGASAQATADNLIALINGSNGHAGTIVAETGSTGEVKLTLSSGGANGNGKTLSASTAVTGSATFTFDVSTHNSAQDSTILITDHGATSVTYKAKASGASASSQEFDYGVSATATADNLVTLINSSNGHNGSIVATTGSAGVVYLKQATPGDAGNTTITTSAASVATAVDALDMENNQSTHGFRVTVPTNAGGTGNPIDITVLNGFGGYVLASDEIIVQRAGSPDSADRDLLILAINGGESDTNKVRYGSAAAGNDSTGIAGLTATASGDNKITLATTTAHLDGNNTSGTNNSGNIWIGATFTGGLNAFTDSTSAGPPAAFTGGIDAFEDSLTGPPSNFANGRDADTDAGLTNATKVDIQGLSTSGSYASKFKEVVDAHDKFSASISGNTVTVIHSDAAGISTDTSIIGIGVSHLTSSVVTQGVDIVLDTAGSLTNATEVDIQTLSTSGSIAAAFYTASNNHTSFSSNIDAATVYVTSSATGPMSASSIVGTLSGITISSQQTAALWTKWSSYGGDFSVASGDYVDATFSNGDENLSVDITSIVEKWLAGTGNYGLMIKMSSSYEPYLSASDATSTATKIHNPNGSKRSFYTKKFFSRSSEFFFKKPRIEARWDSSRRDNRLNFYFSSSAAPANDNINSLFYYNYIRGKLQDIAGSSTAIPTVELYYSSGSVPEGSAQSFRDSSNSVQTAVSASRVSKGIYKAQIIATSSVVTSTYPYLVDVWSTGSTELHTGSYFEPKDFNKSNINPNSNYVISISNLRPVYNHNETARFRVYIREKDWSPNIYSKSSKTLQRVVVESGSYSIHRVVDRKIVIPHGTGSTNHTLMSYDASGSYFDLNMNLLDPGYTYAINFSFYEDSIGSYREQAYSFKFRVDKYDY